MSQVTPWNFESQSYMIQRIYPDLINENRCLHSDQRMTSNVNDLQSDFMHCKELHSNCRFQIVKYGLVNLQGSPGPEIRYTIEMKDVGAPSVSDELPLALKSVFYNTR